jgi:hypothetical protein
MFPFARSIALVAVATLAATGCSVFHHKLPQEPGLHPRLGPRTYIEEGNLVALSADVSATVWRDGSESIPVAVAIANKAARRITLGRESFTLVSEDGERYPILGVREARDAKIANDYAVSRLFFEMMGARYRAWTYVPCSFFPPATRDPLHRRSIVQDQVELESRMWTADILYFPHPKGSIDGRKLELWVTSPELPDPVFVKVRVK